MPLPTSYLTSTKNLQGILNAIRQAQAPEQFTQRFLESLEFKSSSDRLIINVLKVMGFLDDQGKPTDRYFRFLDQTQSDKVLAEGVRSAYRDLFQINKKANTLSKQEVINKFKTLSQGKHGEAVLDKMAMTFTALAKIGDFSAPEVEQDGSVNLPESELEESRPDSLVQIRGSGVKSLGGLHYNIQIIMPESRDPKVYDALFRSLKEHLFD